MSIVNPDSYRSEHGCVDSTGKPLPPRPESTSIEAVTEALNAAKRRIAELEEQDAKIRDELNEWASYNNSADGCVHNIARILRWGRT